MLLVRRTYTLATCILVAAAIACGGSLANWRDGSPDEDGPKTAREQCWASFSACAPPARFGPGTDVAKLSVRGLVQVADRLDVPDRISEFAATRLRKIAMTADQPALLEIEASVDATTTELERCRCKGERFKPELEKQGIAELVASRLPSREMRSPEHWAGQMLADLVAIREIARRSAMLVAGITTEEGKGAATGASDEEKRMRDAQRHLCETVHGAREILSADAFHTAVDMAYRKHVYDAGEGSAAAARKMIDEYAATTSCVNPEQ